MMTTASTAKSARGVAVLGVVAIALGLLSLLMFPLVWVAVPLGLGSLVLALTIRESAWGTAALIVAAAGLAVTVLTWLFLLPAPETGDENRPSPSQSAVPVP